MGKIKTAVFLLGFGAPDSLDQVEPFLRSIFSSQRRAVPPSAFDKYLKDAIKRYEAIGGKSPLLDITKLQAEALEKKLREKDSSFKVYVGMRNCYPFIEETLREIFCNGAEEVIVLSLSPQYNDATTGSNIQELKRILSQMDVSQDIVFINSWCDNSAYLDALSGRVEQGLSQISGAKRHQVPVLFSAHSLPKRLIEKGNPYLEELEKTIAGVLERVGGLNWQLCFQSRGKVGDWLEPDISDVIKKLGEEEYKEVLVVPISFIADNVEVLYDIDIALRKQAEDAGIDAFKRTECLNDSPKLVEALTGVVLEYVGERD